MAVRPARSWWASHHLLLACAVCQLATATVFGVQDQSQNHMSLTQGSLGEGAPVLLGRTSAGQPVPS